MNHHTRYKRRRFLQLTAKGLLGAAAGVAGLSAVPSIGWTGFWSQINPPLTEQCFRMGTNVIVHSLTH